MYSKIFFLVLLGASLVLADIESDYLKISDKLDREAFQKYYATIEPLSLRLQWDAFLARSLYIIETGRQKALEKADISEIDKVRQEWIAVQEQGVSGQFEVKTIIDSLRKEALVYAPKEWAEVQAMSISLFEAFKKTAADGDASAMKRTLNLCKNSFRKINVSLRAIMASRQKSVIQTVS